MMSFTEQRKQQTASVWLGLMLVSAAVSLFSPSNATAQGINIDVVLPQHSEANTDVLSGLPTLEEISSTKVDEKVKQIIAQLDSPAFVRREAATQLLNSENIDRRQICKVLTGNDLSSEQRHRLVDWLKHDLISTPHAAIGISISLRRTNEAIVVNTLIENLPAIEVLIPGDQIVSLDGLPINDRNQFLQSIGSRKPGDKVTITIKRSFEPDDKNDASKLEVRELDFEIVLGSDELLFNGNGTRTGNALVQQALNRDLVTIVDRYGPKVLHIESGEAAKRKLEATAVKEK